MLLLLLLLQWAVVFYGDIAGHVRARKAARQAERPVRAKKAVRQAEQPVRAEKTVQEAEQPVQARKAVQEAGHPVQTAFPDHNATAASDVVLLKPKLQNSVGRNYSFFWVGALMYAINRLDVSLLGIFSVACTEFTLVAGANYRRMPKFFL